LEKKELLKEAKNILRFFEEKFGTYPFGKLDVVRRLWSTIGGHSPASFIILNELYQPPDSPMLVPIRSPVDLSRWKEYFIAHEIAHQWWGHAVTWKTYHDHWLSEGMAQFAAVLYLSERYGKEILEPIFGKLSQWTEKKSKWGPITLGPRISLHDPTAFQTVVYNKAALALNMLKDLLGEEIFFTGLKKFYLKHRFDAASTSDFIEVMEETAGKDLKIFFRDWFDSYVLPKVNVSHSIQKSSDGYVLKLKINQMKEVFIFPLWIEWIENGDRFRQMVLVDEKIEEFEISLGVKPQKIEINPDNAVPGKFH
jgi:aminopeptidase N